jgi:hypothetical protein
MRILFELENLKGIVYLKDLMVDDEIIRGLYFRQLCRSERELLPAR